MNQSGDSPSDIKSPPLVSQTSTSGLIPSKSSSTAEQRPNSLYTTSYRPQPALSMSNYSQSSATNDSNKTMSSRPSTEALGNNSSENGSKTIQSSKNVEERKYTEIERIEVPKHSTQGEDVRVRKSETSTDPPMKSGQSSDDEDDSSDSTSTDSFSECSESSNECAKIDFADEDGIDEEGMLVNEL